MHFEVLVEDQSGKKALDILISEITDGQATYRVINYRGSGRIPKNLKPTSDANKRILLDQIPRLLRGYGKTFADYPSNYSAAVILICDLDDKCLKTFRQELLDVLDSCNPKPETRFCIAIEEGEAWLLGDIPAIKAAYPKAKNDILNNYKNDSVCGTWELLADSVFAGGSAELTERGWQAVGREKYEWAEKIAPHMDVDANASPSFRYFRDKMRALTGMS